MTEHVPVVVVGAGPTGATAAILLASYGIKSLVLDRWHDVYPQPRAVHLDDEVYRILAHLGVAEGFAAISRPALGLRLVDRNQRLLAEFRRSGGAGLHGHPQANMFDQPELERLLRQRMDQLTEVRLEGGCEVVGLEQSRSGPVLLDVREIGSGRHRTVSADYVLGCDGANSTVRPAIGSRLSDLGFEQRWLVLDVDTGRELGQWEGVHQVCDTRRAATYMRIGERRHRWEFQLLDGEDAATYAAIDDVLALIAPWTGDVPSTDLRLVRVADYTFRAQLADRWRRDKVFILGDAAHLTPPFIGQGMGAGLRDAHNLAWKLAGVLDATLDVAVLDTYEVERRPHARTMIRTAVGIGVAMTGGGATADRVRRVALPLLHLVPGLRQRVVDSATPRLARSMLGGAGSMGRRGLVGTLCPNVELETGGRLDGLPWSFLVVTTTEPTPAQRRRAKAQGAHLIAVGPGSELTRWLRSGRVTVAVVRPDRAVLHAGSDLDAACALVPTDVTRVQFVDPRAQSDRG